MHAYARLAKLRTDDGFCEVVPGVAVGRRYLVDLASERVVTMEHVPTGTVHQKVVIEAFDESVGGWRLFVRELLDLES